MKKLLSLFLFLFSLVIVGCKKESSYIEFKTTNIVMEYNSIQKVEYEVYGDVKDIRFTVINEKIVTFDDGFLTAHSAGETILNCTYNTSESIDITVTVLEKGKDYFEVGNPSLNQKNYDLLKEKIDEFSEKLSASNYLSLDLNMQVNNEKSSQKMRTMQDPIYIEVVSENYMEVITQEDDKIFYYTQEYFDHFNREYIGLAKDYKDNNDSDNSEEVLETTTFDKNKCNVKVEDNIFTITCYYEDAVNEESKDMLEELYSSLGLSVSTLYDTIVTMQYVIFEDKVYMSTALSLDLNGLIDPIDMKIIYEIDLKEFTPIDMLNGNYSFSLPDCFEEVYDTFDFKKDIELKGGEKAYLQIETERGMIVTDAEDVSLELYDLNRKLISSSLGKSGEGSYVDLDSYLVVPEEGTYYLVVKNRISSYNYIDLDFCQYETVLDEKGIDFSSTSSYEGEIEGKYDFEKFVYNNNSTIDHSIRIKNTSDAEIGVYHNKKWHSEGIEYIKPHEVKYLVADPGYNEFYICEDFLSNDAKEGYEYSFESSILEFAFDGEVYEEEIPNEIFLTEYGAKYYYSYLEKGQYSIVNSEGVSWSQEIVVYDKNGKKLNANVVENGGYLDDLSTHFVINENDYYYVGILNHSSGEYKMIFSKYNYETIIDKNNPKVLDVSGITSNEGYLEGNHDFEYYTLENNTDEIKIYRISNDLETSINLIYREYKTAHLMEETLAPDKYLYFASNPGVMEFIVCQNYKSNDEKSLEYSFKVEELENNNITDLDSSNLKEITQDFSEDYIMTGYCLPAAYMKLDLKEKGVIRFDYEEYEKGLDFGMSATVVKKNGERIDHTKALSPGVYYVKFEGNDHIFGYAKVKYTLFSTAEKNINVTLKELDDTNNNGNYSDIYNEKVTTDQVVKYHFSLEEKTTIYYNSSDTVIYQNDGKQMVFIPVSYWYGGMTYVDLEAGDYYFTNPDMYGSTSPYKSPIYIGIKSKDRDAPQDLNNMVTLNLGEYKSFKKDYSQDCEYLKFIADEKGKYITSLSEGRGYLFNENLEYIGLADEASDLEEGTYYLVVEYTTYSEGKVDVKVIKY